MTEAQEKAQAWLEKHPLWKPQMWRRSIGVSWWDVKEMLAAYGSEQYRAGIEAASKFCNEWTQSTGTYTIPESEGIIMASADTTETTTRTTSGTKPATKAGRAAKASKPAPNPSSDVLADLGVVPVWDSYPELVQLNFGALIERRTQIKDELDFRKKKLAEMDAEIQALMLVAGAEKVTWEDRPVQIVNSSSGSKIVPEKLLMAGVAAQTIADATVAGSPYSYILVGKVAKK